MAATAPAEEPRPKSPPPCPLVAGGRRRLQLEMQCLSREIGLLEEELQTLEGIQPVLSCCKEINEFVGTKPDPLIPREKLESSRPIWRCIRSNLCCCLSWICCSGRTSVRPKIPDRAYQSDSCPCHSCCYSAPSCCCHCCPSWNSCNRCCINSLHQLSCPSCKPTSRQSCCCNFPHQHCRCRCQLCCCSTESSMACFVLPSCFKAICPKLCSTIRRLPSSLSCCFCRCNLLRGCGAVVGHCYRCCNSCINGCLI